MTTAVVRLSDDLRRQIVDHCLAALPNEGCGLVAMEGDLATAVYPTRNLDESPISYTIAPDEHYRAFVDAEERGWDLGGVFHSHPNGPAVPSAVDVEKALDLQWVYLVVALRPEPVIRGWRLVEGDLVEIRVG